MRYLVDTHALIWWWDESPKLSRNAAGALRDRRNVVHVSAVAGWEIANKVRSGKLPNMATWINDFGPAVTDDGFVHLDLTHRHSIAAGMMAGAHRDPFDRMLAAQAMVEDLVLITRDREIAAFGCKVLW